MSGRRPTRQVRPSTAAAQPTARKVASAGASAARTRTATRTGRRAGAERSRGGGRAVRPGTRPARTRPARRTGPLRIPLASTPQRLHVVLVAVAIALSLCAGRLLQLQGFDSSAYAAVSAEALTRTLPLLPSRGEITDRNGLTLAATQPAVAVTADPSLTAAKAPQFAAVLSKYLGIEPAKLTPLLTKPNSRFVYLKKQVPSLTYSRLSAELAEQDLYGVFRESDPIRTYPGGTVAGGLVGFVSNTGAGQAGLELSMNRELAGVEGKEVYESSPNGGKIPLGTSSTTPAKNGLNYQLSIDSELQWVAERRIAAQVRRTKSDFGFAITMNVKTGEILSMAQAPTVDASKPAATKQADRGIRAVSDPYEPGSVEKVLTAAALVESGHATADTPVLIPPTLASGGGMRIKDFFEHEELQYTMRGVVANSSNIGMVMLARQMPKAQLISSLQRFGLGTKTGVELPIESAGILPKSNLQDLTRDQIAFGQALAVTGVQQVSAVAGLVNKGVYNPPTVIKQATNSDGTAAPTPDRKPRRVVSGSTSKVVRDLMQAVVDTPNGQRNLSVAGYETGGKTGTAQRADPKCGCYKGYVTSYIGFAPLDDPQIITYVVLNNPRDGDTGTSVAAPVYRDIMQFALPRYSVPPTNEKHEKKATEW